MAGQVKHNKIFSRSGRTGSLAKLLICACRRKNTDSLIGAVAQGAGRRRAFELVDSTLFLETAAPGCRRADSARAR
jgi:hypothetical protein